MINPLNIMNRESTYQEIDNTLIDVNLQVLLDVMAQGRINGNS